MEVPGGAVRRKHGWRRISLQHACAAMLRSMRLPCLQGDGRCAEDGSEEESTHCIETVSG